jgi:hypothetical protein
VSSSLEASRFVTSAAMIALRDQGPLRSFLGWFFSVGCANNCLHLDSDRSAGCVGRAVTMGLRRIGQFYASKYEA